MSQFSHIETDTDAASVVESEALAWIAQLNGDSVTEKDLAAFREWVNRSPAHQAEIRELAALWTDLNALTVMDEPIRQADAVSKRLRKQGRWKRWAVLPVLAGAAAVCALVLSPVILPTDAGDETYQQAVNVPLVFKTAKGEHQVYSFEDGSIITLNTDSHIEVDFNKDQRDVRLIKGEALFTVAHDEKRPFLVFANDGIVRAVGTEFSVHLANDAIDVLVSEGSVELSTLKPTQPSLEQLSATQSSSGSPKVASLGIIKAGQTARVKSSEAAIALVSTEVIDAELSWRVGRIEFTGEGLEQAIDEYTRYTNLNIVIADPELNDIRLGGSFPTGETDLFFNTLELQFGINVDKSNGDTVYLTKAQ